LALFTGKPSFFISRQQARTANADEVKLKARVSDAVQRCEIEDSPLKQDSNMLGVDIHNTALAEIHYIL
jgi:hypothetical protein